MAVVNVVVVLASFFLIAASLIAADPCQKPQVTSNVYTTTDGTLVTNIGFIAEFSVSCVNNVKNMNLYADINGKTMPVTKAFDGNRYQVSWTAEPKQVKYYYLIKIFDEDGFAALRRAQRTGDDVSSIQPLFPVEVNHPGTYNGPWFQSELMAGVVALGVWYFAYTTKSKLMA